MVGTTKRYPRESGVKVWDTKRKTIAELQAEIDAADAETERLMKERERDERVAILRDLYLEYLNNLISLEEFWQKMLDNGLCGRIGVWGSSQ